MIMKFKKTGWVREEFESFHDPVFDSVLICHDVMEHEPKRYKVDSLNDEFMALGRSMHIRAMPYELATGGSYDRMVKSLAHDIHYILGFDMPLYFENYEIDQSCPKLPIIDEILRLANNTKRIHPEEIEEIKKCMIMGYYHAIKKYGKSEASATKMVLDLAEFFKNCDTVDYEVKYDGRNWILKKATN
jgi:hypothetical protein